MGLGREGCAPRKFGGRLGRARPLPVCGRMCVCISQSGGVATSVRPVAWPLKPGICLGGAGPLGTFWPPTGLPATRPLSLAAARALLSRTSFLSAPGKWGCGWELGRVVMTSVPSKGLEWIGTREGCGDCLP